MKKAESDANVYPASGSIAAPLWEIRAFGPYRLADIQVPSRLSGFPKTGPTVYSMNLDSRILGWDMQSCNQGNLLRLGAILAGDTLSRSVTLRIS